VSVEVPKETQRFISIKHIDKMLRQVWRITIELIESKISGDEKKGRAICPICGRELCSWITPH